MPKLDANPPVAFGRLLFTRWLMAAFVVFSAYNPSGYSYYHWASTSHAPLALRLLLGLAILIPAVAIARMAFLSIGLIGTAALGAFVIMIVLMLTGLDFVSFASIEATTYFVQFWISFVLAAGTSWSFLQRRISGERDVIRNP